MDKYGLFMVISMFIVVCCACSTLASYILYEFFSIGSEQLSVTFMFLTFSGMIMFTLAVVFSFLFYPRRETDG